MSIQLDRTDTTRSQHEEPAASGESRRFDRSPDGQIGTGPSPRELRVEGGDVVLRGAFEPPGDKSIAHRAAMLAAVCEGTSRVRNYPSGLDCASTLRCLRSLGVDVRREGDSLIVSGRGLRGLAEPADVLDAGNSGTTMRLLSGILAGQDGLFVVTGDESLRRRPMARIARPLRAMGAWVDGRAGGGLAPLVIRGAGDAGLRALEHVLSVASAQVKSCILLAGLYADGETTVVEPAESRDHTERLLQFAGVPVRARQRPGGAVGSSGDRGGHRGQGQGHGSGAREVSVCGGHPPHPFELAVPGDPSSAAFLLAAAAALPGSSVTAMSVCANPTRLGFIRVLAEMGASVTLEPLDLGGPEPVAHIRVEHSGRLVGAHVPHSAVPSMIDEIPIFAVLACVASSPSSISGIAELRVKETDRVAAVIGELSKMGAHITEDEDSLHIHPSRLRGARVSARGDHRMAMALAVAGLLASGTTVVEGWESARVSYPGFLDALVSLGAGGAAREDTPAT
ncbi:MAG TPA: 3-phosphoshikimate 1-carboxyvinyltransferase [Firmicutes bacterium]|nr:3-phosphoshikimate 1-carboxyvinyltransferase [Bacillota bacterium]